VTVGHAFVQNLRRGRYDIATELPHRHQPAAAFNELQLALCL
jgi:transposase, IS6 family